MTDGVTHQRVADEVVAVLTEDLALAGNDLEATAHPQPESDDDDEGDDRLPERFVHPSRPESPVELEVLKPRSVELQGRHDPVH